MFLIDLGTLSFLIICLSLVCIFEFINGFHDTANAVAPVIYTKSMEAKKAVLLSGIMNFLGVLLGGIGVAMAIVHLLPLEIINLQGRLFGVIVVFSLLLSAIIWNFLTWYFGIPSSSSHALIGSILGVTIFMTFIPISGNLQVEPNWGKAIEIIKSLFFSPIIGFMLALFLMYLSYKYIKNKYYFSTPSKTGDNSPKTWLKTLLIGSSAWVSFAHGSNDGQKGIGLAVLILVLIAPSSYIINPKIDYNIINNNVVYLYDSLDMLDLSYLGNVEKEYVIKNKNLLLKIKSNINKNVVEKLELREDILLFQKSMKNIMYMFENKNTGFKVYASGDYYYTGDKFHENYYSLSEVVDYSPLWVIVLISISLGLGTLVGRKRIVVTIGEKIGNTQMNYAQAASSSLITATTISLASIYHLPVSTTHILSSSVAGTMVAGAKTKGVQKKTITNIIIAWILTLPVTILLSISIFLILRKIFL